MGKSSTHTYYSDRYPDIIIFTFMSQERRIGEARGKGQARLFETPTLSTSIVGVI
jgi:hypothetical protein